MRSSLVAASFLWTLVARSDAFWHQDQDKDNNKEAASWNWDWDEGKSSDWNKENHKDELESIDESESMDESESTDELASIDESKSIDESESMDESESIDEAESIDESESSDEAESIDVSYSVRPIDVSSSGADSEGKREFDLTPKEEMTQASEEEVGSSDVEKKEVSSSTMVIDIEKFAAQEIYAAEEVGSANVDTNVVGFSKVETKEEPSSATVLPHVSIEKPSQEVDWTPEKIVLHASQALDSFEKVLEKERGLIQNWKEQEAARLEDEIRLRIQKYTVDGVKTWFYCQQHRTSECGEALAMTHQAKVEDIKRLETEKKTRFNNAQNAYLKALRDLELKVRGAMSIWTSHWTKHTHRDGSEKRTEELHVPEKEFNDIIEKMNELCDRINAEMRKTTEILFAKVCMTVEGYDEKILPYQEVSFNANCALGIELAFANEGLPVDILQVAIVDQKMENVEDGGRTLRGGRGLRQRVLRMVVGTSFRCACYDGSTDLKGDVVRRRLSNSMEQGTSRDLLELTRSKDVLSLRPEEKRHRNLAQTESVAIDMMRYSNIEEDFAETLSNSINEVFEGTNITVAVYPCPDE